MADTKKPAAKKAAAKPVVKADGQNQMNTAAAEQAEQAQKADKNTAGNVEQGKSPKELRAELNAQFEKADEKGKAAIIDETQVGLQVRGY